jgi:SpoVK/Ycf46/Vps4 family AAA+-type ATPase
MDKDNKVDAPARDRVHGLQGMMKHIKPAATWAHLNVPRNTVTKLRAIRGKFARGKGMVVLFSGPSGADKDMAAEAIANDLHLNLYRVDLSAVVSRYIGETEKNLGRIFAAAAASDAILLFDEADALFGKRSEVTDSHDRYANTDSGLLLQQMENHEGMVILATNMRSNIDDAFVRRIRFVVDFPVPAA